MYGNFSFENYSEGGEKQLTAENRKYYKSSTLENLIAFTTVLTLFFRQNLGLGKW